MAIVLEEFPISAYMLFESKSDPPGSLRNMLRKPYLVLLRLGQTTNNHQTPRRRQRLHPIPRSNHQLSLHSIRQADELILLDMQSRTRSLIELVQPALDIDQRCELAELEAVVQTIHLGPWLFCVQCANAMFHNCAPVAEAHPFMGRSPGG